jgi:hypothetical protein
MFSSNPHYYRYYFGPFRGVLGQHDENNCKNVHFMDNTPYNSCLIDTSTYSRVVPIIGQFTTMNGGFSISNLIHCFDKNDITPLQPQQFANIPNSTTFCGNNDPFYRNIISLGESIGHNLNLITPHQCHNCSQKTSQVGQIDRNLQYSQLVEEYSGVKWNSIGNKPIAVSNGISGMDLKKKIGDFGEHFDMISRDTIVLNPKTISAIAALIDTFKKIH